MTKKNNLIKLGDAINQLLSQEKLDIKISQFSVKNNWHEIAGDIISKNTNEINFNEKTIFIGLNSSALKHELSFRKDELIKNINKFCGYKLVEQVVIK
jgi:predicted nucleic acid-binding Zn ribbon protein